MERGPLRPLLFVLGVVASLTFVGRRWTDVVAVRGSSMAPALHPGDLLLVERWTFTRRTPRVGEVVLATDPREPSRELIKRVAAVRGASLTLRGDGTGSSDSRAFGPVALADVRWRVAFRYWPLARIGRLPAAPPPPPPVVEQGGEAACSTFGDLVVAFDEPNAE